MTVGLFLRPKRRAATPWASLAVLPAASVGRSDPGAVRRSFNRASILTLGANDFPRALTFHDRLLVPLGQAHFRTDPAQSQAGYAAAPTLRRNSG